MALKTLDPAVKAAFASAGITLSPAQEHVAAEAKAPNGAAVDWLALLKNVASVLIPVVLGFFGINLTPAKAAAPGCCDHHACACKVFKSSLETTKLAAEHVCECCC